ncbi:major facilitator superfamily domain-containing protein [Mycena amicta]|nr:major facilitator superfamily domain-containing protein [Mycena amicta]
MPSGPATAPTPLPKLQLTIALLIQSAESLSSTVIFPFVPQFVRDTGITGGDERKTGYWAGVLESIFFLAEFLSVYVWSLGSDTFGRRPILLLGPLGLAFSLVGFGLSKTFTGLLVWRCAQGVFNGNIGVVKTVIAEFSEQSNLARAMSFIPVAWDSGSTLGPIIGGLLADPAVRFPALGEKFPLLKRHPYFLPCAAVALICVVIFLLGVAGLRETSPIILARQKRAGDRLSEDLEPTPATGLLLDSAESGYGTNYQPQDAEDERIPTLRELLVPRLSIPLLNYGFYCFCSTAHQVLFPLMYSTSIPLGGLGFTPYQIGVVRGAWGVFRTLFQVFISARIIAFLGPRRAYIFAFANFTVCIGAYPVMSYFAQRAGRVDRLVWAVIVLQGVANSCISISSVTAHLYIVTSAPRPSALSSTNSIAQMVSTILRGLAPFLTSALFAFSLERGSQLVYVLLLGIVGLGMSSSLLLQRDLKR